MLVELYRNDQPALVNINNIRLIYPDIQSNPQKAILEFIDGMKIIVDNTYEDVKDMLPYLVS